MGSIDNKYIYKNKNRKTLRYSRIKFVFAVSFVMIIAVASINMLIGSDKAMGQSNNSYITIKVSPGETMWSIAENHKKDDMDIREAIYLISEANDISANDVKSDMTLRIPTEIFK